MTDRMVIILSMIIHKAVLPLSYDNILFLANRIDMEDEGLKKLESAETQKLIDTFIES